MEETEKDFIMRILREHMDKHGVRRFFVSLPVKTANLQFPVLPIPRLNIPLSGTCSQQLHDRRLDLTPGDAVLALPGSFNSRGNMKGREGATLGIVFMPDYVRFVYAEIDSSDSVRKLHFYHTGGGGICSSGHHLLEALMLLSQNTILDEKELCRISKYIIFVVLDQLEKDAPGNMSKAFSSYRRICDHIYHNFQSDLTRGKVALEFEINPCHVSRLFSTFGKENFNAMLRRIRLEYASKLLKDSRMTVKEIATQAGFSGACYFIQAFKSTFGVSPIRFRNK